jgi:citrate lyase subunit beta/citryl-CoA lyase
VTVDELRARPPRTWLLVPALNIERMLPRAFESGADAIIIDLEAATPPAQREHARRLITARPRDATRHAALLVRVNDARSTDVVLDEETAATAGADGIVMPRVESAAEVVAAAARLSGIEGRLGRSTMAIVPMLETARGFFQAAEIAAAHPRVTAIALGGEDLAADLGATRSVGGGELVVARGLLVLAAAAAGIGSIDTPWLDLGDPEGAGREAAAVRGLGISGKFAIHPAQVGPVNRAFTPTLAEIARARGVVAAYDDGLSSGTGISVFEDKMIDEPIARNARRTLDREGR